MNSFLKFLIFASLLVFLIPFYLYRIVYFSVVVDLATITYLLVILNNKIGQIRENKLKEAKQAGESNFSSYFNVTPIAMSVFIFILVSALAVIFSVDIRDSFWGYPAGHSLAGGFFIYIHYFLFFVVITLVFKKKEDYFNLLRFFIGISFIISLYGLYERFTMGQVRIDSLFGNPIHLGIFSLFAVFLSVYFFLGSGKKSVKAFYLVSVIAAVMAMYFSESRGPFVGFVGSLIVVIPIALFWAIKNIKDKKVVVLSALTVLLVIIFSIYFSMDSRLISRFKNISTDSSVSHRVKVWKVAFEAIKEKPILGWGQENFGLAFNKYFDSELLSGVGPESWFDRVHNNILDIWVTTGTFGIISYLLIWCSVVWAILNLWRRNNIKEAIIFSLVLISYFISNLTFFDVVVTFIPFVLILGFLNNFGFQEMNRVGELKIPDYFAKSLIIIMVVSIIAGIQLARGSYYYYSFKIKGISIDSAVYYHDKLMSLTPAAFREEAIYALARMLYRSDNSNEIFNQYYKSSIDELREISDEQSLEVKTLYHMVNLYLKDYEVNDNKSALDDATGVIKKALNISSGRKDLYAVLVQIETQKEDYNKQDFYVALAQTEMQKENYNEAIKYIEKAQELNPKFSRTYFFMSVVYLLNNQPEESEEQLEKAKEYGITFSPEDTGNLMFLANHFISGKKDYNQAIYLLDGIFSVDEYNIQALKKISALYAEMGNKEKAIKYAKKVIIADPTSRVEAEKFIKSLDGL